MKTLQLTDLEAEIVDAAFAVYANHIDKKIADNSNSARMKIALEIEAGRLRQIKERLK